MSHVPLGTNPRPPSLYIKGSTPSHLLTHEAFNKMLFCFQPSGHIFYRAQLGGTVQLCSQTDCIVASYIRVTAWSGDNHTLNQTALLHQIYMSQLGGRVWSYSTLVHWPQCKQSRTTSYNHLCCMLSPRKKQDLAGRHIQHEYTHCQSQQDQHQSLAAPWGTNTSLLAPTVIGEGTPTVQEYTQ